MHSSRSVPQIVDHQVRPIFAETIGEDSLIRWMAAQVQDRVSHGLNTTDCLHRYCCARCVPDADLNGAVWVFRVELHYVDKIRTAAQPAASDRQLLAGAKRVAEWRLGNRMRWIAAGTLPLVIDQRTDASLHYGLAANRPKLIRPILTIDCHGESLICQLLGGARHCAQRPCSNN